MEHLEVHVGTTRPEYVWLSHSLKRRAAYLGGDVTGLGQPERGAQWSSNSITDLLRLSIRAALDLTISYFLNNYSIDSYFNVCQKYMT